MPPAASVADQPGTPAASAAFLPGEARPGSPGPPAEEAGRVPGPAAYLAPGGGLSACLSSGPGGSPAALQAVRKADRRPCRGLGQTEGLKAAVL